MNQARAIISLRRLNNVGAKETPHPSTKSAKGSYEATLFQGRTTPFYLPTVAQLERSLR